MNFCQKTLTSLGKVRFICTEDIAEKQRGCSFFETPEANDKYRWCKHNDDYRGRPTDSCSCVKAQQAALASKVVGDD